MSRAAVVGSGPNGLAAAVTLARAGLEVKVYELSSTVGGGVRTAELTLPGFWHDVCSTGHPMALVSPFFREFELAQRIEFCNAELAFAHPLDDGRVGLAYRDLDRTIEELGRDGNAYGRFFSSMLGSMSEITDVLLNPLLPLPKSVPAAVLLGLRGAEQTFAAQARYCDDVAPALITGASAHSIARIPGVVSATAGVYLTALAHTVGWPLAKGGSQAIADAMLADLLAHGGSVELDRQIETLSELDEELILLDVSARALERIGAAAFPERYRRSLRAVRYGDGSCKLDLALSGPIPWRNPELSRAPIVHLGGTRAQMIASERAVAAGQHPERPFVLLSQPGVVDPSRAPAGRQTLWAYTHVPAGSDRDVSETILDEIERHVPGTRDLVLGSSVITAAGYEHYNPNYQGGDISAGALTLPQLLGRPVFSTKTWRTPVRGVYLCSAAAVPGPAVHGMVGWHAAVTALQDLYQLPAPELAPDSS
ncbi:phytoene dehydrogenase-like protein [Renibacterium salmoninarum ATCC 33209]|uniref:Phytoene dehydrogenase-like protein n=1 Tax=Renibacterium salmoninarum (strain ATCC 33209 / DSM 20767 / JCM 11484 / NBRC 15589 / NCIMB 2235) TaxID=288705 RepID=A9WVM9_RENSM|nr:NAD(P)/FAD-dependent oxidoreductase [Renibacterium salmoninarum]ABY25250.1 phytoene dehydrogenase-like protein [Renibacterium salmoninarum ATCC 33209]